LAGRNTLQLRFRQPVRFSLVFVTVIKLVKIPNGVQAIRGKVIHRINRHSQLQIDRTAAALESAVLGQPNARRNQASPSGLPERCEPNPGLALEQLEVQLFHGTA
jgi:hypothetical protein